MDGVPFAAGQQMLIDGQLNFIRSGLEVFLRVTNFPNAGEAIELGVPVSPSGANAAEAGFTDIIILPPPAVKGVSMHNIGMSGGKLMFGAKQFVVSHTFVQNIMDQYPKIPDTTDVWRTWDDTSYVLGLVYNNRLYSIEDIGHVEVSGTIVKWKLTCNVHEKQLDEASEEVKLP